MQFANVHLTIPMSNSKRSIRKNRISSGYFLRGNGFEEVKTVANGAVQFDM